jgi:hypothetical protein
MAERKVVIVRLRPALHAALQRWAAAEFRSVNGQIEYLLAQALRRAGRLPRAVEPGGGGSTRDGTEGEAPETEADAPDADPK